MPPAQGLWRLQRPEQTPSSAGKTALGQGFAEAAGNYIRTCPPHFRVMSFPVTAPVKPLFLSSHKPIFTAAPRQRAPFPWGLPGSSHRGSSRPLTSRIGMDSSSLSRAIWSDCVIGQVTAKYWRIFLEASVFPAPLSPEMRMKWLFSSEHIMR